MNDAAIDRLSGGFRAAQVLFTACRLGIFDALEAEASDAAGVARRLGLDPRGARILLEALAALELIEWREDRYHNSRAARLHLVQDAPRPKLAHLLHQARLYQRWGHLVESVRTGRPVDDAHLPGDLPHSRKVFAEAMANSALGSARLTAEALDLEGARHMLDVGGGPGVFAEAFARRAPDLRVTVLDDPETLAVARRRLERAGLDSRIGCLEGNVFETDLGGPYDLVLISNVLHIYAAPDNQRMIRRCAGALAPGGRVVLKDFFLADEGGSPAWNHLFAVNMLVSTEGGDGYSVGQAKGWLAAAGLEPVQQIPLTERSLLIVGRRNGSQPGEG